MSDTYGANLAADAHICLEAALLWHAWVDYIHDTSKSAITILIGYIHIIMLSSGLVCVVRLYRELLS